MRSISIGIISLVLACTLTQCKPKLNNFTSVANIDPEGWAYGDAVEFTSSQRDTSATGLISIAVRHTNLYPLTQLWLELTVADSLSAQVDTIAMNLADDSGRWLGHGIGSDFQLDDTIAHQYTIVKPATLQVRHIMHTPLLRGIEQIGISFTEITH